MICPICSSNSVSHQSRYRFNHSCFENLNRVACKNCGLQFSNPMPNEQNLISYNNSYHLSAHGGFKRTTKNDQLCEHWYVLICLTIDLGDLIIFLLFRDNWSVSPLLD